MEALLAAHSLTSPTALLIAEKFTRKFRKRSVRFRKFRKTLLASGAIRLRTFAKPMLFT
jgi:hypothetical protein